MSTEAPELPMSKPEDVGISSDRLSRIPSAMQRYIDRKLVPGVATLVARQGKVVHLDAQGFRDVDAQKPMETDTIFRIASMTKPITSVALMMLFEEGNFLLSDPVSKWIPEFSDPMVALPVPPGITSAGPWKTVPAERPITIRHLLTHTGGLAGAYRGSMINEFLKIQKPQSRQETIGNFVKRYAKLPLNSHPGTEWNYSRSTCVVGHLVEILSGMTLDEFFQERIFKPLQMVDTHFYLPEEKLNRFAAQYTPDENGQIKLQDAPTPNSVFVREPHLYFMGSGGLVSTLSDYFRFNQMMLNGGELDGVRILGRKTVELMTRNHIGDLPVWLTGHGIGFGLGYAVVMNNDHINSLNGNQPGPPNWSVGTYTWGGAFCTYQWVDPVEKLTGILMTQVRPYAHLNIRHEFIVLANQAITD